MESTMRFSLPIVLCVALSSFAGSSLLAEDYLTKEGKLAHELKLVQLQSGFAGQTGTQWTIALDGSWSSASVFNQKITPKEKGKLQAKELAKLGEILKKYDLAKLPEKTDKKPGANPHTVALEFGKQTATFISQVPPELDSKKPAGSVESRFAGISAEVTGLLMPESKK